jgi:hypothetical protein
MTLFFIIVFAIVTAVSLLGELRRPASPGHWIPASKAERWLVKGMLAAFGFLLFAAAR